MNHSIHSRREYKVNPRSAVLKILKTFEKHPGSLERIIDRELKGVTIDHRDRRFIFEIVYGIIRRQLTLDYVIDMFLAERSSQAGSGLRHILHLGLYQLLYMDRVPDHAAVNETVNLTKSDPHTAHLAGVVNGVLRNVINNKKQFPLPDPQTDLIGRLSIEFSHPRWMIERWLKQFGLSKTKSLLAFNNEKPAIYLRRKVRDLTRQQFEADVRTLCDPATGYLNLYYRLKRTLLPENLRLIQQGLCNIQAPSSGWVVALMEVSRGDHILDVCAAPGGKTALMSELATENGTICACELKLARLMNIVETTRRMRLDNVYAVACDGLHPPFAGYFDKVLLDVPCMATGVMQRHPDARWIKQAQDIDRAVDLQKKLLDSACALLGKGGVLVYSTCSLEPEENELQVTAFLSRHPEFVLDKIPDSIPNRYIDNSGYLRITPFEHELDGMFGARLLKVSGD